MKAKTLTISVTTAMLLASTHVDAGDIGPQPECVGVTANWGDQLLTSWENQFNPLDPQGQGNSAYWQSFWDNILDNLDPNSSDFKNMFLNNDRQGEDHNQLLQQFLNFLGENTQGNLNDAKKELDDAENSVDVQEDNLKRAEQKLKSLKDEQERIVALLLDKERLANMSAASRAELSRRAGELQDITNAHARGVEDSRNDLNKAKERRENAQRNKDEADKTDQAIKEQQNKLKQAEAKEDNNGNDDQAKKDNGNGDADGLEIEGDDDDEGDFDGGGGTVDVPNPRRRRVEDRYVEDGYDINVEQPEYAFGLNREVSAQDIGDAAMRNMIGVKGERGVKSGNLALKQMALQQRGAEAKVAAIKIPVAMITLPIKVGSYGSALGTTGIGREMLTDVVVGESIGLGGRALNRSIDGGVGRSALSSADLRNELSRQGLKTHIEGWKGNNYTLQKITVYNPKSGDYSVTVIRTPTSKTLGMSSRAILEAQGNGVNQHLSGKTSVSVITGNARIVDNW